MGEERNALIDKVYCCAIPFSSATEQHHVAVQSGKPERSIYVEGRGAETFEACVKQFRSGGTLGLVGGLRVLGASRQVIVDRVRILKAKGIVPYDLETGCRDEIELLDRAMRKILGGRRFKEKPRVPRRIGRKGGIAKGVKCQERRNDVLRDDIVRRLCKAPELTWKRRAEILGPTFPEGTIRRLYGRN